MTNKADKKQLNIQLPELTHLKLRLLAVSRDQKPSDIVAGWIEANLAQKRNKLSPAVTKLLKALIDPAEDKEDQDTEDDPTPTSATVVSFNGENHAVS